FGARGERDLGLHLARVGVENIARTAEGAFDLLAGNEMTDVPHFLRPPGRAVMAPDCVGRGPVGQAAGGAHASRNPALRRGWKPRNSRGNPAPASLSGN